MNRLCMNTTMSHRLIAVATAPIKSGRIRRLEPLLANVPVAPSCAVASFSERYQQQQQQHRWMATYNNKNKSKKRRDNGNHHGNHPRQQQQQQQQRQTNQQHNPPQQGKRGGGGSSGGGGGNNKRKQIKIRPVFGNFDERYADDGYVDEEFLSEATNRNLNDIKTMLEDDFDMDGDGLEFYNERNNVGNGNGNGGGHWKLLTKGEVDNFRGEVMKVRNPKAFDLDNDYGMDRDDDDDDDDNDVDADDDDGDLLGSDGGTTTSLRNSILKLVDACKKDGYKRMKANEAGSRGRGSTESASTQKLTNTKSGTTISTKEWVIGKSSENRELLWLLADNIGALDHIVQCLHFDAVWDGQLSKESLGGGQQRRRQLLDYQKNLEVKDDGDDNFWSMKEESDDNFWDLK